MYSKIAYGKLLEIALNKGYRFLSFSDPIGKDFKPCIYLRHDVDYSLNMAVELAKINASLKIRGTFFLLLRSQVYNLLSHWSLKRARQLIDLGQSLAFHYAIPPSLPDKESDLATSILIDFQTARRFIPEMEAIFSWHNPSPKILNNMRGLTVEGLINAYSPRFTEQISYFSDSNMRHSVEDFEHVLSNGAYKPMQLLLHPFNWIAGGANMKSILALTWQYIIKEREEEIGLNATYQKLLPDGMPESVLQDFSHQWLKAAGSCDSPKV